MGKKGRKMPWERDNEGNSNGGEMGKGSSSEGREGDSDGGRGEGGVTVEDIMGKESDNGWRRRGEGLVVGRGQGRPLVLGGGKRERWRVWRWDVRWRQSDGRDKRCMRNDGGREVGGNDGKGGNGEEEWQQIEENGSRTGGGWKTGATSSLGGRGKGMAMGCEVEVKWRWRWEVQGQRWWERRGGSNNGGGNGEGEWQLVEEKGSGTGGGWRTGATSSLGGKGKGKMGRGDGM